MEGEQTVCRWPGTSAASQIRVEGNRRSAGDQGLKRPARSGWKGNRRSAGGQGLQRPARSGWRGTDGLPVARNFSGQPDPGGGEQTVCRWPGTSAASQIRVEGNRRSAGDQGLQRPARSGWRGTDGLPVTRDLSGQPDPGGRGTDGLPVARDFSGQPDPGGGEQTVCRWPGTSAASQIRVEGNRRSAGGQGLQRPARSGWRGTDGLPVARNFSGQPEIIY